MTEQWRIRLSLSSHQYTHTAPTHQHTHTRYPRSWSQHKRRWIRHADHAAAMLDRVVGENYQSLRMDSKNCNFTMEIRLQRESREIYGVLIRFSTGIENICCIFESNNEGNNMLFAFFVVIQNVDSTNYKMCALQFALIFPLFMPASKSVSE